MKTLVASLEDRSSDRHFHLAAILIGTASIVALVQLVIGRLVRNPVYDLILNWAESASLLLVVGTVAWAAPLALREMDKRRKTGIVALESQRQVEVLFGMTDMLQSALGYPDANAVLRSAAAQLLPSLGGALYIFNNSGDRLELSTSWSWSGSTAPHDAISPGHCWALKRGKRHFNFGDADSLNCQHHADGDATLEIPMMARGEVYGLLLVQAQGDDARELLESSNHLAGALADAMSLALSNIALRDKLRTQALRDPLTGLYNRRYMEDALDRYANLADRNESKLSAVMFDLDHFKRLNDEHGHAFGDVVLASVAAAVLGAVRPCDVACRYGGEEFVVMFPNCSLNEAVAKAEELRARIERLSENHGAAISASFGVATIPESSSKVADLLTDADAALYRAKAEGRNRVVSAARLPIRSVPKQSVA